MAPVTIGLISILPSPLLHTFYNNNILGLVARYPSWRQWLAKTWIGRLRSVIIWMNPCPELTLKAGSLPGGVVLSWQMLMAQTTVIALDIRSVTLSQIKDEAQTSIMLLLQWLSHGRSVLKWELLIKAWKCHLNAGKFHWLESIWVVGFFSRWVNCVSFN